MEQMFSPEEIKHLNEELDSAQKYGEVFADWIQKHPNIRITQEQRHFIDLTLSKMTLQNPMLLVSIDLIQEIVFGVYQLGYRSGWESAKSDSLLGDKK